MAPRLPEVPPEVNPFTVYTDFIEDRIFGPTPRPRLKYRYMVLFGFLACDILLLAARLWATYLDGEGPLKSRFAIWRPVRVGGRTARVLVFSTLLPINCILSCAAIIGVAANYYSVFFGPSGKRVSLFWVGLPALLLFLTGVTAIVATAQAYIVAKRRQARYWLRLDVFNYVCIGTAIAVTLLGIGIVISTTLRWHKTWQEWLVVENMLVQAEAAWPGVTPDEAWMSLFMPAYEELFVYHRRYVSGTRMFLLASLTLSFSLSVLPACVVPFVLLLRRSIKSRKEMASPVAVGPPIASPGLPSTPLTPPSALLLQLESTPTSQFDLSTPPVSPPLQVPPGSPFSEFSDKIFVNSDSSQDRHVLAIKRAEKELIAVALGVSIVSATTFGVVVWNYTLSYRETLTANEVEWRAILIPFVAAVALFNGACVLLWNRCDLRREEKRSQGAVLNEKGPAPSL